RSVRSGAGMFPGSAGWSCGSCAAAASRPPKRAGTSPCSSSSRRLLLECAGGRELGEVDRENQNQEHHADRGRESEVVVLDALPVEVADDRQALVIGRVVPGIEHEAL